MKLLVVVAPLSIYHIYIYILISFYLCLYLYTKNITSPCLLVSQKLPGLSATTVLYPIKHYFPISVSVFSIAKIPITPPLSISFSSKFCLSFPPFLLSIFQKFPRWRILRHVLIYLIRSALFDMILFLQSNIFALIRPNMI